MFNTFSKAVYKWSIYAGTLTDPEKVIADFMLDISSRKPANVEHNNTMLFVWFKDINYMYMYSLPIAYKKYVVEG